MTLISGLCSLLLATSLCLFVGHVAELAGADAHAQMAADAAALAAVAESAPFGGADPTSLARRYAAINGGSLIECRCEPGATAMQVAVDVDGVIARARAVLDPSLLRPGSVSGWTVGLDPLLKRAVETLVNASGGAVVVVSGFRTTARQSALWSTALDRYGSEELANDWVAPPGHSMHERGLAVDLGGDLTVALRLVDELDLPLYRPLRNEPWHFELLGSR